MLNSLFVQNYALIDHLSVDFNDGFSIITGETGAGKSILLGALGLVLGNRVDSSTLKDKTKKCIVEATFNIEKYQLQSFFKLHDLDYEDLSFVRREILPSGKSRAFINDTPTTLNTLQILSKQLIDVHSQHQTLDLTRSEFQFEIIDALAENQSNLISYKKELMAYREIDVALKVLQEKAQEGKNNFEYQSYLLNELEQAKLVEDEQEEIEQQLDKLNNIENIKDNLSQAYQHLNEDELGLLNKLNATLSNIESVSNYSENYRQLKNRLASSQIEIEDIANELERILESLDYEPNALSELNNRLQLIYDLQKKHHVGSIAELLIIQNQLSDAVSLTENSEELLAEKIEELANKKLLLEKLAKNIADNRSKTIPIFIKKTEQLLAILGMENTRLSINLERVDYFLSNGNENIHFKMSADKGKSFGTVQKIASGGELSRLMLAIKYILSDFQKLPTIIFDEIDSGISGKIADKMGDIMKNMSKNMQVLAITHLPQIAAKGNKHYKVYKEEINNEITTKLKVLSNQERIAEIAMMLSGGKLQETALEHAKQLLN
ncbi:MAG: DNA repair protein RecN [Lutibacter sp.]